MKTETLYALTSLSPAPARAAQQRVSVASWRNADLHVISFNHPSEFEAIRQNHDVELVAVENTSAAIFGGHYIPINAVLRRAAELDAPVLLINSDIELRLAPWEMKRIRRLSEGGLCYFIRHNHAGDQRRATREPYGIDAFFFHGRDAGLVPDSFLSIGQPFWDYLLPHLFAANGRRLRAVEFPAAFHRDHPRSWSWENWHRCSLEAERIMSLGERDLSFNACVGRSVRLRQDFDSRREPIAAQPSPIREWVVNKFQHHAPKTFLELGSHRGTDTAWMANLPNVTIHAFEPDPRNHQPARANVFPHRMAVADRDGRMPFILSQAGWGQEWTHSSSLRKPKSHLQRYPVTFGETIEVETIALDTYFHRAGLDTIDFIWADIQGAEGDMIRGAQETLRRTRYLFTEYSDDELYEGQFGLSEITAMLPDFRVLELWPDDVLLENTKMSRG